MEHLLCCVIDYLCLIREYRICLCLINPEDAKLRKFNFHPLEVVSRYRDSQLQVGENYSYLVNLDLKI